MNHPQVLERSPAAALAAAIGARDETPAVRTAALPHVCFVSPALWPVFSGSNDIKVIGGAEVQQGIIARALARAGYRVSIITLDYGQPEGIVIDGVSCHKTHTPDGGIRVVRWLHPRLTSVISALKRVDADIYYTRSSSYVTGVVAAFCKRHGKRSVYAGALDLDFLPGKERIQFRRDRWLFQYGLRNATGLIVQNTFQYGTCLENYGREPTLIPSSYVPPEGASADRAGHVLWVANIRRQKQPDLCLEIARNLPHLKFVMIGGTTGDGREMYRDIEAKARQLPNVEFLGFQPYAKTEEYFNRARVFLNTSRTEGFPNTFLQAWARGIPTVAFFDTGSRMGDAPVYPIAAGVSEAQAEVQRLMTDDVHWKQASDRCREHFRAQHSVDAVTSIYARVFAGVMADGR
jgi:glycosyltransferase involved in cell wall biosynthesis